MTKQKTAEEILLEKVENFNLDAIDFHKFKLSHSEIAMFVSAMEEYASQFSSPTQKEAVESGWISVNLSAEVSDDDAHIPERGIPVLQYSENGTMTIGKFHWNNWIDKKVTHWMALPLLPKQK